MSSGRSNKSNNGGGGVVSSIPAQSRKMVQSLKEVVNCSEEEIYTTLKECNFDPNDAVHRLLSQDRFHEVKSKREKKKEIKETSESRPRGVSTTSSRGGRSAAVRYDGRSGTTQYTSSDSGGLRGKPAYKKENGTADLTSSTPSTYGMPGTNINRQPVSFSASVTAQNKPQTTATIDGISSSSQPLPGFQSAWVGAPGQVSMADIVKMGRRKASGTPNMSIDTSRQPRNAAAQAASNHNVNYPVALAPLPRESSHGLESSQESASKVSESINEAGSLASQHVPPNEWNFLEQSSARGQSVLEPLATAEVHTVPSISSNLQSDRTKLHIDSWSDDFQETEKEVTSEHLHESYIGSASASNRQNQADDTGDTSRFEEDSFNDTNSFPPQRHTFESHEDNGYSLSSVEDVNIAVSSASANLQQLNLQERGVRSAEVNPAVIIPNHLQIPTAECSHLSFGSFGSVNTNVPGSYASNSLKSNLEESSVAPNATSSDHSGSRASDYFGDDCLQSTTSDGNVAPRTSADADSYDNSSQSELMKQDGGEAIRGHQYNFPSSVPAYMENSAQLNAAFPYEQTNSHMQNLAPLSTVMQAYSNSLQGIPVAPTVQHTRESSDHTYSPFLTTESMPTKYNTAVSSINGPSLSMPENLKPGMFSMPHPTTQTLPGTNIATGPGLPQHLAVHPYSQPNLPLGHFANMIGFPYVPQSYAYIPPAYQQAYAGNSTYHQSPAAVHNAGVKYTLPQYKSSVSVSSLPQSASAYGGFGSSVNIPGSFQLNPSTSIASTTIGYDDVMSSQYKESNHFLPLQQNDSSGVWVQGPSSRPVSALPASTYYSFQGQGQQHSGFRQAQQPSQHYGNLSYQNFYHSQAGASQEHQQQTPNEGTLSGSQGPPSKQSHQIWQHSY